MGGMRDKNQQPGKGREEQEHQRQQRPGQDAGSMRPAGGRQRKPGEVSHDRAVDDDMLGDDDMDMPRDERR
ncbi:MULTISPECIES: hypothetical protein [unclassified Streptomyces]|uniref:hypothetical protein n=1 Tax=unclassified Streptomyces TaxID=2593676 RepID=UPI002E34AB4E|nr:MULTISPECIES: hypothetical protein [unclassified Streptomyces]WUC67821.1 hypothetical protein OG861_28325 [Streptomyces sp. NBC_00539]